MLGHARSENVWDIAAILFYRYSHHKLHFELLPWETWGFRTRSHPLVKHRRSLQASERSKRPQATQALVKQTGVLLWSPAVHMWFPKIIHFNRIVHDKPTSFGIPRLWKPPCLNVFEMVCLRWIRIATKLPATAWRAQPSQQQLAREKDCCHVHASRVKHLGNSTMYVYIYICVCAYVYIYNMNISAPRRGIISPRSAWVKILRALFHWPDFSPQRKNCCSLRLVPTQSLECLASSQLDVVWSITSANHMPIRLLVSTCRTPQNKRGQNIKEWKIPQPKKQTGDPSNISFEEQ